MSNHPNRVSTMYGNRDTNRPMESTTTTTKLQPGDRFETCPVCEDNEAVVIAVETHTVGDTYRDGEPVGYEPDDSPNWVRTIGTFCATNACKYSYMPGREGLPVVLDVNGHLVWDGE